MRITKKQREGMLNEELERKLDLILEHTGELLKIKPTVDTMAEDMEDVKSRLAVLELGHKEMSQDIKEIKAELKGTSTHAGLREIEKRVTRLEARATA